MPRAGDALMSQPFAVIVKVRTKNRQRDAEVTQRQQKADNALPHGLMKSVGPARDLVNFPICGRKKSAKKARLQGSRRLHSRKSTTMKIPARHSAFTLIELLV